MDEDDSATTSATSASATIAERRDACTTVPAIGRDRASADNDTRSYHNHTPSGAATTTTNASTTATTTSASAAS